MKQTLQYDQLSCRLKVEGLPDVSVGQGGEALGIITMRPKKVRTLGQVMADIRAKAKAPLTPR